MSILIQVILKNIKIENIQEHLTVYKWFVKASRFIQIINKLVVFVCSLNPKKVKKKEKFDINLNLLSRFLKIIKENNEITLIISS